jgi:hypothetical protein
MLFFRGAIEAAVDLRDDPVMARQMRAADAGGIRKRSV